QRSLTKYTVSALRETELLLGTSKGTCGLYVIYTIVPQRETDRREMTGEDTVRKQVDQFIADAIDTVPHLEALLLLWNSKPRQWNISDMAKALYVSGDAAQAILGDLERLGFAVSSTAGEFTYRSGERDALIDQLDRIYRREVVRISRMIHAKPSAAVREFARAFRFKKD